MIFPQAQKGHSINVVRNRVIVAGLPHDQSRALLSAECLGLGRYLGFAALFSETSGRGTARIAAIRITLVSPRSFTPAQVNVTNRTNHDL